jgi:hypothetical protein
MPTRKLNRALITTLLFTAVIAAQPGTTNAQTCGASTGRDDDGNVILTTDCGPSSPASGVNTSRGRGPVCTYRPATAGEVIGIANQDVDPGTDVTAPTIPTDINGRPHQLTIRTCNGTATSSSSTSPSPTLTSPPSPAPPKPDQSGPPPPPPPHPPPSPSTPARAPGDRRTIIWCRWW